MAYGFVEREWKKFEHLVVPKTAGEIQRKEERRLTTSLSVETRPTGIA